MRIVPITAAFGRSFAGLFADVRTSAVTPARTPLFRDTAAQGSIYRTLAPLSVAIRVRDRVDAALTDTRNALKFLDPSRIRTASSDVTVDSLRGSGVSNLEVLALSPEHTRTFRGAVTAAERAVIEYRGDEKARVTDSASFRLTGDLGSTRVSMTRGESLAAVAERVNRDGATAGVAAQVVGNRLLFESSRVGSAASVKIDEAVAFADTSVSGVDPAVLRNFTVVTNAPVGSHVLEGSITYAASRATLTYTGENGLATHTGAFAVEGTRGLAGVAVRIGESLADVAARVNLATGSTGVTAHADGDALHFESVQEGSAAAVSVRLLVPTNRPLVSGVDPDEIAEFSVDTIAAGASTTLAGSVLRTAGHAELSYVGTSEGTVGASATFSVTGDLGSAEITLTRGESLRDVADRLNALSDTTGVLAAVDGSNLVFSSEDAGSGSTLSVVPLTIEDEIVVSGVNPSQFAAFSVVSVPPDSATILSGSLISHLESAELIYTGSADASVTNSATFDLTGDLGKAQFSIIEGESLAAVAERINAESSATGATATVEDNRLVIRSIERGATASLSINIISVDDISGLNEAQVTSFQVNSHVGDEPRTISGTVTAAADRARLVYAGSNGKVASTAIFSLAGNSGSASFTVSRGESLSAVRDRINGKTAQTGVRARVDGGLVLESVGIGGSSSVSLTRTAGTFAVSGGSANGSTTTAYGNDISLVVDGVTHVGNVNTLNLSDGGGSYTLEFAAGFTGAFDPITISPGPHAFQLLGGDGTGHDVGRDAEALINGQTFTSTNETFDVALGGTSFSLRFEDNFLGDFDPIEVHSSDRAVAIVGGNGAGSASGSDAEALIDGEVHFGNRNSFSFENTAGAFTLTFANGFTGAFSPVAVSTQTDLYLTEGGNGDGTAEGIDALATVNGRAIAGKGNSFTFTDEFGSYRFDVASGFTGALGPLRIDSAKGELRLSRHSANGRDATAVINGQLLSGEGNVVRYRDEGSLIDFEFAAGLSGPFGPVTVTSSYSRGTSALSPKVSRLADLAFLLPEPPASVAPRDRFPHSAGLTKDRHLHRQLQLLTLLGLDRKA